MKLFKLYVLLFVFCLVDPAFARDDSRGKGLPNDPVSERSIGQSLDYSVSPAGRVVPVSPTNPVPAELYAPGGEKISIESIGPTRALAVHNEDIDVDLINFSAHEETGTTYTLASAIAAGDTAMTVTDATGIVVGMRFEISEGSNLQKTLPTVTSIAGAPVITLDGPFDSAYTTAATVEVTVVNMAVAGTLASPVTYLIKPHASEVWHITRMNFTMVHKSQATDALFGSLTALTNGVVIRSVTDILGIKTLTNAKSNQDWRNDMFDVVYSDKAGPSLFGTAGRWSWKQRTDAIIRLDGATGDQLEILIQDDLTASTNEISDFQIKIQGHVDEGS